MDELAKRMKEIYGIDLSEIEKVKGKRNLFRVFLGKYASERLYALNVLKRECKLVEEHVNGYYFVVI